MLSLVFGATVHAFELMLAAFIGGLAFGGLWIRRRIDGYASPLRAGGFVQVLMGLAALASLAALWAELRLGRMAHARAVSRCVCISPLQHRHGGWRAS